MDSDRNHITHCFPYNVDDGEESSPSPNLTTACAVQYLIPTSCRILATQSGNENEHHEIIIISPMKRRLHLEKVEKNSTTKSHTTDRQ